MKTYSVSVKMPYFAIVDVEAGDEEQAKEIALRQAYRAMDRGVGSWGDEYTIDSIVEYEGDDK